MKKAFSLVEVMIVVVIIVSITAIAITNLLRARITTHETLATSSLKLICVAMVNYKISNGTYEGVSLLNLSTALPPYIDSKLGSGRKDGYDFNLTVVDNNSYLCFATAQNQGVSGVKSFCIMEDGVIRVQASGGPINNYEACSNLTPFKP